jgi:hypothetical protein
MLRRGRVDVAEGVELVVAIDTRGGDFASGDFAEYAVACHFFSFLSRWTGLIT